MTQGNIRLSYYFFLLQRQLSAREKDDCFDFDVEREDMCHKKENYDLEGRRIVSIKYLLHSLQAVADHSNDSFGCRFSHLKCIGETRKGFISTLRMKCQLCNAEFNIDTDDPEANYNVNHGIVAGIISIGCGLQNLNELATNTDIPAMSKQLYNKTSQVVYDWFHKTAEEEMRKAGEEEAKHAKEIGSVDSDGNPMITVIADGCWSKRSFRNNYAASSGAAAIIGAYTGKLLYLGIKNKYCMICARAANNKTEPKEHKCYKNFTGSSSSMESAALVEGFKTSLDTHGLIYEKLISDGDSSTIKKILSSNPYKNIKVEKIECRNHLLRNLCTKLRLLIKDTQIPLQQRKLFTESKIMKLRRYVVRSIKLRKHAEDSQDVKISNLNGDIYNALHHALGNHTNCVDQICPATDKLDIDVTQSLQNTALWLKMSQSISYLASNAKSLIFDVDSNIAETFNSVIAKYVGGKRINFTLRNSYQERCSAAAISFNTKTPITAVNRFIFKKPSGKYVKIFETNKTKQKKCTRQFRKKFRTASKANDPDYGANAQRPDMSEEVFEVSKQHFLRELEVTTEEREKIQRNTLQQSHSQDWIEQRKKRLTASIFGKICKRKNYISCAPLVKSIVTSKDLSHIPSIAYGKENEEQALQQLAHQENIKISKCGLFVHKTYCFLAATPDGIFKDKEEKTGVVEVKCPHAAKDMNPENAIKEKKITFWKYDKKNKLFIVDKNHNYYYQIQGQLEVTEQNICVFAVWTGKNQPMKVEYIERDEQFWKTKMLPPLTKFFYNCLLPELIDSRIERSMPIKDPPYIMAAIEKKKQQQSQKRSPLRD